MASSYNKARNGSQKIVKIEMFRGLLEDVKGLPKGRFYNVIDHDVQAVGDYTPEEYAKRVKASKSKDTTTIYIRSGVVAEIKNLPRGYGYKIVEIE